MRKTFVKTLETLFQEDPKVVIFLGDIGAFLLRSIQANHPERFFNVGISEAAMMSAAAGMALDGWKPFVYTITPFVTSRCFDQVRVGVGYHHANVKIVGVGSGVSYSPLGATHHSIEDIAIMRAVPGMRIFTPGDPNGTVKAVREAAKVPGPVYIRLTLNMPEKADDSANGKFTEFDILRQGQKVLLLSYGETVKECLGASDALKKKGINPTIVSVNCLKPLARKINSLLTSADYIFTVEEHSIIGGLGSAISEVLAELPRAKKPQLVRMGINDQYVEYQGHKPELYKNLGLDAHSIYRKVLKTCKKRNK